MLFPSPVIILHVDAVPCQLACCHVHAGGVTFTIIITNHGATAAAAAAWSGISSNALWGGEDNAVGMILMTAAGGWGKGRTVNGGGAWTIRGACGEETDNKGTMTAKVKEGGAADGHRAPPHLHVHVISLYATWGRKDNAAAMIVTMVASGGGEGRKINRGGGWMKLKGLGSLTR